MKVAVVAGLVALQLWLPAFAESLKVEVVCLSGSTRLITGWSSRRCKRSKVHSAGYHGRAWSFVHEVSHALCGCRPSRCAIAKDKLHATRRAAEVDAAAGKATQERRWREAQSATASASASCSRSSRCLHFQQACSRSLPRCLCRHLEPAARGSSVSCG